MYREFSKSFWKIIFIFLGKHGSFSYKSSYIVSNYFSKEAQISDLERFYQFFLAEMACLMYGFSNKNSSESWNWIILNLTNQALDFLIKIKFRFITLPELVCQIRRGTIQPWSTQVCETSALIGSPLIVYSFHSVAN